MAFNWFKKDKRKGETDAASPSVPRDAAAPEKPSAPSLPDPVSGNQQSEPPAVRTRSGFFGRLKSGLSKTRESFSNGIEKIFAGKAHLDDDQLEALEELLITSDIGVPTAMALIETVSRKAAAVSDANSLRSVLKAEIVSLLKPQPDEARAIVQRPHVTMIVGVNGVGKTTTIGKLAANFSAAGETVLIAAADTFRAAAVEQLSIWADRSGAAIVRHKDNADPAAVVYDSIEAATARGIDRVLIDTAGRIHTKVNLMEELKKIRRTIAAKIPEAPHEILLVLDATTGQNALSQAKWFDEALGLTGLVVTKLDGTAKGGVVIAIRNALNLPIKYIGVGEHIEDLQIFDPQRFAEALF